MDTVAPQPGSAAIRLADVIGKNAHRLRKAAELTLDQVSIAARKRGLNWSESRVADFESGRVAPNLATLVAFCLALEDAGCADATLPELLQSETLVRINDSLLVSGEQVVNLVSRRPVSRARPPRVRVIRNVVDVGATEERTRKALGISWTELAELSEALWNTSFSMERDRRAGPEANAQKRGQISRQMRKELQAAIEAAARGDDK